ncbi:MGH1-like glycoside hydrolase domain-containing protein [Edaphobacter sp. HDX4]|uniref:MGH1-like glycoside hydrolase domain-containing protein n=1 Tax=Edaphobacter sp. HDX4 TaxID=2794064 RepID=UPI002FE5CDBA
MQPASFPASKVTRRSVLQAAGAAAGLQLTRGFTWASQTAITKNAASAKDASRWRETWDAALACLAGNVRNVPRYDKPVLFEGAVYKGIWQECGPQEGLVYGTLAKYVQESDPAKAPLAVAKNNHMAFFALQREDGQLPASVKTSEVGYGQIQMVVPIAATAWEVSQLTRDEELLETAYKSCGRWDAWLRRYRNTRGTGLVEGFCTYDTGHDNSPRWKGVPNRCPDADAKKFPTGVGVPRLCPDLSATVYGGRVALSAMAKALGKSDEAARWESEAEELRLLILSKLYNEKDAAFYDLDADNKFVRVRSDVISRVLGEHVLKMAEKRDRTIFEAVWKRQIHNPKAFWAPYPLTSIAMDDPSFVRPIPRNSWGGATQALTALRTPRWMGYYGKDAELKQLMGKWCEAIMRHIEFRQQMDPETGDFTQADPSGYSPAALTFLEFARRLGHAPTK